MSLLTRCNPPTIGESSPHARLRSAAVKNVGSMNEIVANYQSYVDYCFANPMEGRYGRPPDNVELLYQSLYEIFSNPLMLGSAYKHCFEHGGRAAGADQLKYEDYPKPALLHASHLLKDLSSEIRAGSFDIGQMKPVKINKPGKSEKRKLFLANIETRWVERAIVQTIRPLFEREFLEYSMGGRPNRCPRMALEYAQTIMRAREYGVWLVFDVRRAFDNIPRSQLFEVMRKRLHDSAICDLIERLVEVKGIKRGIRQGSSISPLLMNLYADHFFDKWWQQQHPDVPMVRYIDDIAIFCRSETEAVALYGESKSKLLAVGLPIKESLDEALCMLSDGKTANWLGVQCSMSDHGLQFRLTEKAWSSLAEGVERCILEKKSSEKFDGLISGWINSYSIAITGNELAIAFRRLFRIYRTYLGQQENNPDLIESASDVKDFSFS